MPQRIAISIGDINGIGPEVVLKSLADTELSDFTPIVLSNRKVLDFYSKQLNLNLPIHYTGNPKQLIQRKINLFDVYEDGAVDIAPGTLTKQAGKWAMKAVEKGIELCLAGQADALVTAPISKEAIAKAGYKVAGHTEFLAQQTGSEDVLMILVNNGLRVGLVSTHVPLAEVPALISQSSVFKNISVMYRSLRQDFNIRQPRIAVLGLNPHAGDGGIIGMEEVEIIEPAILRAQQEGMQASGPHPADGFFGNRKYNAYDGILAMYHDQGLIPFKTLSFGAGVNFTAGLPIIRTSPDHGTAFDIAGQNKADPSSFRQALKLAGVLAENRKHRSAQHE